MEVLGYVSIIWVLLNFIRIFNGWVKLSSLDKYLCFKCFTFWLVLVYTFDPFISAISSLVAFLLDKYLLGEEIKL